MSISQKVDGVKQKRLQGCPPFCSPSCPPAGSGPLTAPASSDRSMQAKSLALTSVPAPALSASHSCHFHGSCHQDRSRETPTSHAP